MDHKPNFTSRSTELIHSFWDLHKNFMKSVQDTAIYNELSVPQYIVLMALKPYEQMTQKKIRAHTYLPKSTLSYALDSLYKLNYIERQHVANNRRELLITLTTNGKAKIKQITLQENGVYQLFQESVESLSDEQFSHLIETHEHITSYFMERGDHT